MVNFQTKMRKNWKLYLLALVLLAILGISIYNYYTFRGGEWSCIAQRCTEFSNNDNWVNDNCNYIDTDMICEFTFNNQDYKLPLSKINKEQMVSCRQYECAVEVYVKSYV